MLKIQKLGLLAYLLLSATAAYSAPSPAIYSSGALSPSWYNNSWTATVVSSPTVKYNGADTFQATYASWSAVALATNNGGTIPGSAYDTLTLVVNAGSNASTSLTLQLYFMGTWGTAVPLSKSCTLAANTWVTCTVSLPTLGAVGVAGTWDELAVNNSTPSKLSPIYFGSIQLSNSSVDAGSPDAGSDAGTPDAGQDAGSADSGTGGGAGGSAGGSGGGSGGGCSCVCPGGGSGGSSGGSAGGSAGGSGGGSPADGGTASNGQWVMGYYVGYLVNSLPVASIDWTGITHIIFGPLTVNPNGTLNTGFDDENGTGIADAQAVSSAAHANGDKALLMLGGSGAGANIAAQATPANLSSFVTSLLSEMDTLGYDGIDIDWEDSVNATNLVALAQALRTARPGMLLTYPGGTLNLNYQTVPTWAASLAQSLDRYNLQSYYPSTAYAGSGWASWFSSPIAGESGSTPEDISSSLSAYVAAGIPASKLSMGMAFYAICYTGGITGPRQSTNGTTQTIVGGDNNYPLSKFFATGSTFDTSTMSSEMRDPTAQVPYLSLATPVTDPGCNNSSVQYVTYDDETSIIAKGTFSKKNGYGGIIVWNLAEGWLPPNASGGRAQNSLTQALKTGFLDQ